MRKTVTVLVPAYNEEEVLDLFYQRISKVIETLPYEFELLFVNDGSTDSTMEILSGIADADSKISLIDLSRNYGKERAMAAGFDHARGDAVIIMDADLQDPPELIPELIAGWEQGYDDVYARRTHRKGEGPLKKLTSFAYYRVLEKMSDVPIQKDTGDFRLLSRRALDALNKHRETQRYTKGLFSVIGFPKLGVDYERDPRAAGKTKWNYFKLWNLALEGITSFSIAPLRWANIFGFLLALLSFVYMVFIIVRTIFFGESVQGYPSTIAIILFLGGIQLISLGIIGEYLGRIFNETKERPLYIVKEYHPGDTGNHGTND